MNKEDAFKRDVQRHKELCAPNMPSGYWEDMGLYWAWRGSPKGYCKPPTEKRIVYENGVAVGVWDDDKYTRLN